MRGRRTRRPDETRWGRASRRFGIQGRRDHACGRGRGCRRHCPMYRWVRYSCSWSLGVSTSLMWYSPVCGEGGRGLTQITALLLTRTLGTFAASLPRNTLALLVAVVALVAASLHLVAVGACGGSTPVLPHTAAASLVRSEATRSEVDAAATGAGSVGEGSRAREGRLGRSKSREGREEEEGCEAHLGGVWKG